MPTFPAVVTVMRAKLLVLEFKSKLSLLPKFDAAPKELPTFMKPVVPLSGVVQLMRPAAPFVVRTWPLEPAVTGSVIVHAPPTGFVIFKIEPALFSAVAAFAATVAVFTLAAVEIGSGN